MGIKTLAQLRELAPKELQGASDAQLVVEFANDLGRDPQEIAEYFGMSTGRDSGDFSAGISSGVDVVQMLGTSAAAGLADIVGAEDTSEYLRGQAERQGYESYLAGKPGLDRVEDLEGVGDYIDYAQYQVGKQLPIMGTIAAAQALPGLGQAGTAAGLTRLAAIAPRALGGGGVQQGASFAARKQALAQGEALAKSTMVGTGLGFGSLYQASAEDGDPDPYLALLGAVPYGLAEAAVPAALTGAARIKTGAFTGTLPTRVAKAGAVSGATEAGTELFQTELEIGIDGTMTPEEAASQRLNAAVAGGVTGGALGTLGGVRKAPDVVQNNELGEADLTASKPSEGMQAAGATIAARMQEKTSVAPTPVAALTPKERALEAIKPELMGDSANRMTRGDRIKLTNERKDLQARLDAVVEDSPTDSKRAAGGKGVRGRKAKETARLQVAEAAQKERDTYQDRISFIDTRLEADMVAREAEANLSRAEQGIIKPEQLPEDSQAKTVEFQQVEDGGTDLTSGVSEEVVEEVALTSPQEVEEVAEDGLFDVSEIDSELVSEQDVAAITAEKENQSALNAEVASIQGEAVKGATIDNGMLLGLVEMMRSSAVKPAAKFYKGATATEQDIEAREANQEQIEGIYDALMNVVAKNQARNSMQGNIARGANAESVERYSRLSGEVETAMTRLVSVAGGEANVNAIVASFKKRSARKNATRENPARFSAMAKRLGKTEIKTQAQLDELLDVQLSSAFREYVNGTLGDIDVVRGSETRANTMQKSKGVPSPIENIVDIVEKGGIRAVLSRVADWRGVSSPYAVALANSIKKALDAQMAEGTEPSIVFIEDTDGEVTDPSFNPTNNTVYIHKEASQEEILHETMHAVTQKVVYEQPDSSAVLALRESLDSFFVAVDAGALEKANMPSGYKENASEVVSKIRELRDSGRELDAVLELVAYGTTMREFRELLKSIKSNPSDASKSWLDTLSDVWKKLVDLFSMLIGVEGTMANELLDNSIRLLEFSTNEATAFNAKESLGQTLYMTSSTDMADTDKDGKALGAMFETEAKQKGIMDYISTKFLFGTNWGGKVEAVDKFSSEMATRIREKHGKVAAAASVIAARFQLTPEVDNVFTTTKEMRNIGYANLNKLVDFMESKDVETSKAILEYLDADSQESTALDGVEHGPKLKNQADQLLSNIKEYVAALPSDLQQQFNNKKFTDFLIYVDDASTIASHSLGLSSLSTQLKKQGISLKRGDIDDNPDLFDSDAETGDIILDAPLYKAMVQPSNGGKAYTLMVSKAKYDREGAQLPAPSGVMTVDTNRTFELSKFGGNSEYRFTSKLNYKDALDARKVREVTNAMRNTLGGIASYYASNNFYKQMAVLGKQQNFLFDDVDQVSELFEGITIGENSQIKRPVTIAEANNTPTTRARLRQRGNFVQFPDNPEKYGDLAGKIMHGPVYVAMYDMSDRNPITSLEAYNSALRVFKKAKTLYNPGTNVTNVLSNVSLLIMHDIPLKTLARAAKLLWKYETNSGSLTKPELAMMRAFSESGAMLGNFSSVEIKRELYKGLEEHTLSKDSETVMARVTDMLNYESGKATRLQKLGRFFRNFDRVVSETYAAEDNAFRLAAFVKHVGDEMSVAGVDNPTQEMLKAGGRNARDLFLDYDIDSAAVKAARQTVLPFVSWTYAIIPVLGRILVTKPWQVANLMASYALIDMAASALAGDDDDEIRRRGPEDLNDRIFGVGPRMHIRIPFVGDSENPVYYRLGDYIPLASSVKGLPTGNGFMGMDWWPSGLTPGSPVLSGVIGFLGGVDPYTGNKLHEITDDSFDKAMNLGAFTYNLFTPPAIRSSNWRKGLEAIEGDVNFAGQKVDVSKLLFANILGLKIDGYNRDQEMLSKIYEKKQLTRDYSAAIAKYKREEMRSGNPNYAAMDEEIRGLEEELMKEINRVYSIEE